jgi:hypothetical protein
VFIDIIVPRDSGACSSVKLGPAAMAIPPTAEAKKAINNASRLNVLECFLEFTSQILNLKQGKNAVSASFSRFFWVVFCFSMVLT